LGGALLQRLGNWYRFDINIFPLSKKNQQGVLASGKQSLSQQGFFSLHSLGPVFVDLLGLR
jgi:hypothetical protein